ncbi:MAG: ABC-F family ATP-binding cassette domain-containing protein [Desulfomonilaceae bacterium]
MSISIHRGDRVGIVGPNGAGKSTLLGIMEGIVSCDEGEVSVEKKIRMGVLHQELSVGNDTPILEEVTNASDNLKEIRRRLSALEIKLGGVSADSPEAAALLEEHGRLQSEFEHYDGYTLESRALKVLQGLGFSSRDASRAWKEFSGGWRMRVELAKLLLSDPDLLLLDEPTNHLDLDSLLWVENYLNDFKGALVLVSHDRAFLNRLVKRIIEVDNGKVNCFSGNYDAYETTKKMQEEVLFASYRNQQEKIKKIQAFINQNRVKARTASRVQSRVKMLEKMELVQLPQRTKTVRFSFPQPTRSGKRVVEMRNVVKRYGDREVYRGLNLYIDRGDRIGLVGPNGAGKSTLMKMLAGVIPYDEGSIQYGQNVNVGYFAQIHSESLNSEITVLEEACSVGPKLPEQEVRNLLGAFLFSGDDVLKKVKVLSGGEKSRLALTKILLNPPNFLLMDEPTNHLDIPACEVLERALEQYQGTLVLISHDRRLLDQVCNAIIEIQDGSVERYVGNYSDYSSKKNATNLQNDQPRVPQPLYAAQSAGPTTEKTSKKERRRLEAHARSMLFRKQQPLKREIEQLEALLAEKEARKREIEAQLSDPSIYDQKEKLRALLEESPVLDGAIRELELRWEELQGQLEAQCKM